MAQDGKTLTVGIVSDPVTLDPALMASFFELSVQYNLHEPLVHVTPDLKIEPGLASVETPDALTYRFVLKPNLTFHDGTPIDAAAVKANFDRMLDPATASPRRSELSPIDQVEVTGALTFTIKLKSAYTPLLQVLSNRAGMMVSPTALKRLGPDFATKAVGAGPYKVVSWTKNSELVLERFAGYWRGPVPIECVVFRPIADETVASNQSALRARYNSLMRCPHKRLGRSVGKRESRSSRRIWSRLQRFFVQHDQGAFQQYPRTASLHVRDRQAGDLACGLFRHGQRGVWRDPAFNGRVHDANFAPYKMNVEAARKLLAEAGVATPVPVTITVTNSPAQVRTAEVLQAQANQAGFKVDIKQIDATSLITVLRQKDFDLCMSPWSGRTDPDGNMYNYFTKTGPNNFMGYQSDKVTDLLEKARGTPQQADRAKLYREAEAQLAADAPILFLTFPATLQASTKSLSWLQYPDGAFRLQFAKF